MKKLQFRDGIENLKPSPTLAINEKSKELLVNGRKIYRLGFGQSPFPVPKEVVASLRSHANEKDYLPAQGLHLLCDAVAGFYKKRNGLLFSADQIMIGPGSKELILGAMMVLDADIILPSPSWVSYEPQAKIAGGDVIWVNTEEKDKWKITPDSLEEACLKKPDRNKILILNYPSNPIGVSYSEEELRQLASVSKQYELIVIADEIYGALTFDGSLRSMATYYKEGTIISSGLSKWCGAGGWRLGTFCFPMELLDVMEAMKALASESFSAVSAPVQYAAVTAFKDSPTITDYLKRSRRVLQVVSSYVFEALTEMRLSMPQAEGGFYLFPNFEVYREKLYAKDIRTGIALCEKLIGDTGIALLPGSAFGRPENEFTCRLSFVDFDGEEQLSRLEEFPDTSDEEILDGCPRIKEAMGILKEWLEKL